SSAASKSIRPRFAAAHSRKGGGSSRTRPLIFAGRSAAGFGGDEMSVPLRSFGRHADQVSALGLGGYHLGLADTVKEAVRIVHGAIDAGITFMDNAWEYHDGESETRMGKGIADRRDR